MAFKSEKQRRYLGSIGVLQQTGLRPSTNIIGHSEEQKRLLGESLTRKDKLSDKDKDLEEYRKGTTKRGLKNLAIWGLQGVAKGIELRQKLAEKAKESDKAHKKFERKQKVKLSAYQKQELKEEKLLKRWNKNAKISERNYFGKRKKHKKQKLWYE